ncbi:golgin subfamily A member 6-like protein 26 [Palaemon carinicauda]|uniref:golgin subfamily A member 6-like protein 26 n=1 Tax=Palaemon carinicauda TaxID=392227 RepID=UPI0035B6A12B
MAGNDVDNNSLEEYVPEMEIGCDLLELKMEDEDQTTFLQNLEDENNKLHGQLNEPRSIVDELNRAKETQEKMTFEKASEYQKLEAECVEKILRIKELETLLEILKVKNKEIKKNENEKTEQISKLKRDVDELKDEKKKLESECVGTDLKMKEHENLVKILKQENEQSKKALSGETEQVNNLKLKVEELKNEKDEQKADLLRDYEKLEFVCKIKDLEILQEQKIMEEFKTENEELKRAQSKKTEQLNKLKSEVNELKIEKEKLKAKSEILKQENEQSKKALKENEQSKKALSEETEQVNHLKPEVETLKEEKNKLKSECVGKDLRMEEQENLLKILKEENEQSKKALKENEQSKKALSEETGQVNNLKREVEELKNEKDEQKADLLRDYEKLEFVCKIKDLEILQEKKIVEEFKTENEELKRAQSKKTEQLNKLKSEVNELKIEKEKLKAKPEIPNTENKDEHERRRLLMAALFAQMSNTPKEALNIFTEALTMKTDNEEETALLHFLRAEANAATETPHDMDIVLDCSKAIEKGLKGWKAFMLRGRHLVKLGIFDAALKDFETVKLKKSENFLKIIDDTKALQKQWEDKGHYEVLGLEQTATKAEIIKSFRALSMMFHPDRHRDKPEFLQEAFEKKYKKVVNAKLILADESNRRDYDEELRHQKENDQWERHGGQWYHQEPPRHQSWQWNQQRQYNLWEHRQYNQGPRREEEHRQYNKGGPRREHHQRNDHQCYY